MCQVPYHLAGRHVAGDRLNRAAAGDRDCRLACIGQHGPGEGRRVPEARADRAAVDLGTAMGTRTAEMPRMAVVAVGTENVMERDRRTTAGAVGIGLGLEEDSALERGIGPEEGIDPGADTVDTAVPAGSIADREEDTGYEGEDSFRRRRRRLRNTLGPTCW